MVAVGPSLEHRSVSDPGTDEVAPSAMLSLFVMAALGLPQEGSEVRVFEGNLRPQ